MRVCMCSPLQSSVTGCSFTVCTHEESLMNFSHSCGVVCGMWLFDFRNINFVESETSLILTPLGVD